ncbi:O-methylsterigmatocystin oxidoreductase [Coprinellus micaceus]|uniref:O-methylsterigmatocystin oxidoreductase n=1 Tax=Coprinellus micaceus TaxID=71717 RepID=A0A4Y7T6Y3_COPMI|nr:O-methylsterigmatocystin oxidoreductase [Coprinellus micaceus]
MATVIFDFLHSVLGAHVGWGDQQVRLSLLLLLAFTTLALHPILRKSKRNPQGLPLPPGPKGVPVFGNLFQIAQGTQSGPWHLYNGWAKEYDSDLIYVEAMGQPVLVLNTLQAATDLMERRSPNYSDRLLPPALTMLKPGLGLTGMTYGPLWKANRRAFHQYYNKNVVQKYQPIIEHQTMAFLRRLNAKPKEFMEVTKYLFGSVIVQISYGLSDPVAYENLVDAAETIVRGFSEVLEPGRFWVDIFPILRYVPAWFPGAGWKRKLKGIEEVCKQVRQGTFDDAMERAKLGIQSDYPSVAGQLIEKLPPMDDPSYAYEESVARNATLVAYIAGADTTVSSAHGLYIALVNNPDVQRRAQEELDTVIGKCRLPKPSDIPRLPYIRAIVKELSRWFNVIPLGIPHICHDDDEYRGYFIPKGTMVMGNSWAIMHDAARFDDPLEFKPERYLKDGKPNPDALDPEAASFGYGRRICPGRHLSNESLTYMTASLLSVFNVVSAKDAGGNEIPARLQTGPGFIVTPMPFEIDIVPRSKEHVALLNEF